MLETPPLELSCYRDDSDIEIAVFSDVGELTDEDEGDDNEVNTGEIIIKDVPWSLEFRSGDSFQPEPPLKSPSELFELFISVAFYYLIVKETMRHAADVRNQHDFLTTTDEIRVFVRILLLTDCHSNTCERDYWSDAETLTLPW
ncbi:hypothetical protein TNCV_3368441 [Trichonephila clavipes]|nr:hypothetical protein TNCV_3368441 [Trichonephila clavipes]